MDHYEKVKMVSGILEGRYDNGNNSKQDAVNLLTDIQHFCKYRGFNFNECIETSSFYFRLEYKNKI